MTREVIGRWPLVVEVETVEDRFKIDVKECDERILTVRQMPHPHPGEVRPPQYPYYMTPGARDAWHAEHKPTERPPSDHEMEHVSVRGPADEEPKPETTCTAWGCLRTRDRERLYCDPCGGRVTTVDPYNLTQWPPVEDEPEEGLRVAGQPIPLSSSVRDQMQQAVDRHRMIGPALDTTRHLYRRIEDANLAAARREYARLGELLRELEGES